mmetsp:Transcript_2202/g.6258  ORF Transcript_2202/g.6258 Transcript_2202/m.6258 type:complete len:150 (-) Transcript_2202:92-541(-)|eukprot:CAMPEP_0194489098 /NCGR_PEP_ID=MMETSP0253-20130528/8766_1 /TAXON_ID=2966 /ORGANISM="Noctiluca scintillans" /LENGTH=149 /DNA_ID=CAMNT_0039329525 /DNA_START=69 /DNA_END=518 /DNA_ORIENTATION=-
MSLLTIVTVFSCATAALGKSVVSHPWVVHGKARIDHGKEDVALAAPVLKGSSTIEKQAASFLVPQSLMQAGSVEVDSHQADSKVSFLQGLGVTIGASTSAGDLKDKTAQKNEDTNSPELLLTKIREFADNDDYLGAFPSIAEEGYDLPQ